MIKFEELRLDTYLMYYDGPLLGLYRDIYQNGYLIMWVDENDTFNTWLCCKPDRELLEHFQCGSVDLLQTLQSSTEYSIFSQNAQDGCFNQKWIDINDYPQYLPEGGVYL